MQPSVRQFAMDCEIKPITVAEAYKEPGLARDVLTEKRCGIDINTLAQTFEEE